MTTRNDAATIDAIIHEMVASGAKVTIQSVRAWLQEKTGKAGGTALISRRVSAFKAEESEGSEEVKGKVNRGLRANKGVNDILHLLRNAIRQEVVQEFEQEQQRVQELQSENERLLSEVDALKSELERERQINNSLIKK